MGEPLTPPRGAQPVAGAERIVALDVIRGFALLGVLFMNNHYIFRGPSEIYRFAPHPQGGGLDVLVDWIMPLFFEAKAVTLFSMLFGVGLAIQLDRAAARGVAFGALVVRRLGALLLFGVLHIVLVWWGDILHIYALVGFLLVPFLRRTPRTLLIAGGIFLFLPYLVTCGVTLAGALAGKPAAPYDPGSAVAAFVEQTVGYKDSSWLAVARYRLNDYAHQTTLVSSLRFFSYAFGLFLVGLAAWKRGIFRNPEQHLPLLRRVAAIALPIGLALTAASLVRWNLYPYQPTRLGRWVTMTRYGVGAPLIAFGYAAAILLLLQRPAWRARLAPLAAVGRMALTSYLLQSVIMTTIYEGYGLGLYGKLGPAASAGIALLLFAIQIVVARAWLAHHAYGPMERLWRVLTYGRRAVT